LEISDLDESSKRLEAAMAKVSQVRWGSAKEAPMNRKQELGEEFEKGVSGPKLDMGLSHTSIYDHSWRPIGPEWVWTLRQLSYKGKYFRRQGQTCKDTVILLAASAALVLHLHFSNPLLKLLGWKRWLGGRISGPGSDARRIGWRMMIC
jgi:hypothetical protein